MKTMDTRIVATRAGVAAAVLAICLGAGASTASAQECFLGEVKMFAGNFAPRNYALAQGQLLPINGNEALFSIIGTIYGGDGRTTFALPDLRGRAPIGAGQGPGLSNRQLGQRVGEEDHSLTVGEMPAHAHTAVATDADGESD